MNNRPQASDYFNSSSSNYNINHVEIPTTSFSSEAFSVPQLPPKLPIPNIITYNCQKKLTKPWFRKFLFILLKHFHPNSIILLQETAITSNSQMITIKEEWGNTNQSYFSKIINNDKSNGVAILFPTNHDNQFKFSNFQQVNELNEFQHNFLTVRVIINNFSYHISSIYAPSQNMNERIKLFQSLNYLPKFNNSFRIIGGDFNCVIDKQLDSIGVEISNTDDSPSFLKMAMKSMNLGDAFRILYGNDAREYTYFPHTNYNQNQNQTRARRLDFILMTCPLINLIKSVNFEKWNSDHLSVKMIFNNPDNNKKRKFRKKYLPSQLLQNENYIWETKDFFDNNLDFINIDNNNNDNNDNNDNNENNNNDNNNDNFWENLDLFNNKFYSFSQNFIKKQRKKNQEEMLKLEKEKKIIIQNFTQPNSGNNLSNILFKMSILRRKSVDFMETEKNWKNVEITEGIDSTFYGPFKKIIQKQKLTTCLKLNETDENPALTDDDIAEKSATYFEDFFSFKQMDEVLQDSTIKLLKRKLNQKSKDLSGVEIDMDDIEYALKRMESNKSPGENGIPKEFFLFFFDKLGPLLKKCFDVLTKDKTLSEVMKTYTITLLDKKKDSFLVTDKRPISGMDSIMKIFCKILTLRCFSFSKEIIHPMQFGFTADKQIMDPVNITTSIIHIFKELGLPGYIIHIDFSKAFDRVDHRCILKVLEQFGFHPQFVEWIKTIYDDCKAYVVINNVKSRIFEVLRGVHQGDPLSPILYNLVNEIFYVLIETYCEGVELVNPENLPPGIKKNVTRLKIWGYCDDTYIIIKNEEDFKKVLEVAKILEKITGAIFNFDKTKIMPLGISKPFDIKSYGFKDNDFQFVKPGEYFKSLGAYINFSEDNESNNNHATKIWDSLPIPPITNNNMNSEQTNNSNHPPSNPSKLEKVRLGKLKKVNNSINHLKINANSISIYGRSKIISSMFFSKVFYLDRFHPLSNDNIKQLQDTATEYYWNGNKHQINLDTLNLDRNAGGIGAMDLSLQLSSQRVDWIKKLFNPKTPVWPPLVFLMLENWRKKNHLPTESPSDYYFPFRMNFKNNVEKSKLLDTLPLFWGPTFKAWYRLGGNISQPRSITELLNQPIKNNILFKDFTSTFFLILKKIQNDLNDNSTFRLKDMAIWDPQIQNIRMKSIIPSKYLNQFKNEIKKWYQLGEKGMENIIKPLVEYISINFKHLQENSNYFKEWNSEEEKEDYFEKRGEVDIEQTNDLNPGYNLIIFKTKMSILREWDIQTTRKYIKSISEITYDRRWDETLGDIHDENWNDLYYQKLWKIRYSNINSVKKRPETHELYLKLIRHQINSGKQLSIYNKPLKFLVCPHCLAGNRIEGCSINNFSKTKEELQNAGHLETIQHIFFDCPTVKEFWKLIDKKYKKIINSNGIFKLTFKDILLLHMDQKRLSKNEMESQDLFYLFIVEAIQIIFNYRRHSIDNNKTYNSRILYIQWLKAIHQRMEWAIKSFLNIPCGNENEQREAQRLNIHKEIKRTWGYKEKLLIFDDEISFEFKIDKDFLFK
jgi:hypothetical protein